MAFVLGRDSAECLLGTPLETRGSTYVNQKPYDTGVVFKAERSAIAEDIVRIGAILSDMSFLGNCTMNVLIRRIYVLKLWRLGVTPTDYPRLSASMAFRHSNHAIRSVGRAS